MARDAQTHLHDFLLDYPALDCLQANCGSSRLCQFVEERVCKGCGQLEHLQLNFSTSSLQGDSFAAIMRLTRHRALWSCIGWHAGNFTSLLRVQSESWRTNLSDQVLDRGNSEALRVRREALI